MKITALGHSCILLEFASEDTGESTRILVDPWLSDHATGDAMGRFPRLRFHTADLGPIHAVFLSHAHCDHLDPYTLVRLWRELETPPLLLIPVSLSFLLPIFHEHLPHLDVRVLHAHTPSPFRGLELLGFFDVGPDPTNEEDVMILVISHGSERVLIEADARLALELPEFRQYIGMLMREEGIESAVFLTTENELTGTLESRGCATLEDRENLREYALDEMLEAVEELYTPTEDPGDLWQGEHVLRLIHGQGLTAPHELDVRWHRILFPVRIADRVAAERAAAMRNGCKHLVDGLTVGSVHTIVAGRVVSVAPMRGLKLVDHEDQRTFDGQLEFFPELPCAPVRFDERDPAHQRARVLELLNARFLPYLHGSRRPPVLHMLAGCGGTYRVRVHYGHVEGQAAWDYVLSYGARNFIEVAASHEEPHEAYWGNDLEDFMEGRCDEYTTFSRQQFLVESMQLWACMATPLLHSDFVSKKVGLHFQRASEGLSPGSFVLPLYTDPAAPSA